MNGLHRLGITMLLLAGAVLYGFLGPLSFILILCIYGFMIICAKGSKPS